MAILKNTGIIVKVYQPSWYPTFDPFAKEIDNSLAEKLASYTHSILADGGFDAASMGFSTDVFTASDWYEKGLGYIIQVTDELGNEIWLGIVNQITFVQSELTSTIGPLLDISNDIIATYTPIYVEHTPFLKGAQRFTIIVQDTDSIAKYGTHMLVLNAGEALVDTTATPVYNEAEQARDTYLLENAWPNDDQKSVQFSAGQVSIQLECLGLRHYLEKFYYNDNTPGVTTISGTPTSKLELVLAADPNGIVDSTDFDTNPVLVRRLDDKSRTGQTIISELLTQGGASFERWTFGIFANRVARYKPIPTQAEYALRIGEESRLLDFGTDHVVEPWNVLPGKWLIARNAFPATPLLDATVLTDDRRVMFIETASYTAPYDYSVNGVKIQRLSQMIARMGLKGIK